MKTNNCAFAKFVHSYGCCLIYSFSTERIVIFVFMFADVHLENALYCQITSGFVDPARLSKRFGKPHLTNILNQALTGIRRAKCQVNIFSKKL